MSPNTRCGVRRNPVVVVLTPTPPCVGGAYACTYTRAHGYTHAHTCSLDAVQLAHVAVPVHVASDAAGAGADVRRHRELARDVLCPEFPTQRTVPPNARTRSAVRCGEQWRGRSVTHIQAFHQVLSDVVPNVAALLEVRASSGSVALPPLASCAHQGSPSDHATHTRRCQSRQRNTKQRDANSHWRRGRLYSANNHAARTAVEYRPVRRS